jgi:hypothetical protein
MTSFGEYLRDIVVSECSSTGAEMADEPDIPVVSGKYVLLSDDVSITLRVTTALGTITNQKTFDIPADADYEAMMVSRVDNTLVNVVPVKSWGGGELSISKEVFREGDEVDITFIPKVDCYVTVFNIVEDGTVTVLLPNRFRRDGYARGGAKLVFPGHSEKDNGLVLRAHLPEGKVRTRESIKVVATKSPVDFTREDFTEAVVQSFRPDSQGITKLVANLQDLDDSGAPWFEEVRYFVIEGRDAL